MLDVAASLAKDCSLIVASVVDLCRLSSFAEIASVKEAIVDSHVDTTPMFDFSTPEVLSEKKIIRPDLPA